MMETARSKVFFNLSSCPVCGAAVLLAEKSDNLETVEFTCGAALFLQTGSIVGVAQICPSPTHVAISALERQAERDAMVERPHIYHPSVLHMGDCSICGNLQDHPNHLGKAVA